MKKPITGFAAVFCMVGLLAGWSLLHKKKQNLGTGKYETHNAEDAVQASKQALRLADAKASPEARSQNRRAPASLPVADSAMNEIPSTSISSDAKKDLRKAITANVVREVQKLSGALGQDEVSRIAVSLIMKSVIEAAHGKVPENFRNVCEIQSQCPVDLSTFYRESLNRLPSKDFGNEKVVLENALLKSDLSNETKGKILLEALANTPSDTSVKTTTWSKDKMHLSPSNQFVVATQVAYLTLRPAPDAAITATLTAVRNNTDRATQLLLANNLAGAYPQYQSHYVPQLVAMRIFNAPTR